MLWANFVDYGNILRQNSVVLQMIIFIKSYFRVLFFVFQSIILEFREI